MPDSLQTLLDASARRHDNRLCPRQILGVRIGLKGLAAFAITPEDVARKRLLIIAETDGCLLDGLAVATGCEVGRRTLRVEDYGKVAATFIDTHTERALRIAPAPGVREKACAHAPHELHHYTAQMTAYRSMPEDELLVAQAVFLVRPAHALISRPGLRVPCDLCGEEVMNARELICDGRALCRTCAGGGYYRLSAESA